MLRVKSVHGEWNALASASLLLIPVVRFTLREGGKTIGTGIITKILETA